MEYNAQSIAKNLMSVFIPGQSQGLRSGERREGGEGIPAVNTESSFHWTKIRIKP